MRVPVLIALLLLILAAGGPVGAVGFIYLLALAGIPFLLYRFLSRRV